MARPLNAPAVQAQLHTHLSGACRTACARGRQQLQSDAAGFWRAPGHPGGPARQGLCSRRASLPGQTAALPDAAGRCQAETCLSDHDQPGLRLRQEFYQVISSAEAIVPAFAGDAYYRSTASSSVAAAFLCDTPLLADEQLLRHYSYLTAVRCAAL